MNASPVVLKVAVNVLRIAAAAFIGVNPVIAYMCQIKAALSSQNGIKQNILARSLSNFHMSRQTHEYIINCYCKKQIDVIFRASVLKLTIDCIIALSK